MIENIIQKALDAHKLLVDAATTSIEWTGRQLRRAWATHQGLMASNPAYPAALAAGVAGIIGELTMDPLAAALISALVALYVAAHQQGSTDPWRRSFGSGFDTDWDDLR